MSAASRRGRGQGDPSVRGRSLITVNRGELVKMMTTHAGDEVRRGRRNLDGGLTDADHVLILGFH